MYNVRIINNCIKELSPQTLDRIYSGGYWKLYYGAEYTFVGGLNNIHELPKGEMHYVTTPSSRLLSRWYTV
jgi:hypothetical protein